MFFICKVLFLTSMCILCFNKYNVHLITNNIYAERTVLPIHCFSCHADILVFRLLRFPTLVPDAIIVLDKLHQLLRFLTHCPHNKINEVHK